MIDYLFKGLTIVTLVLVLLPYVHPSAKNIGASESSTFTNPIILDASQGATLKVNTNATAIDGIFDGTCSLISNNYFVVASTTLAMDCAVTGVVSGDSVQAWFATSTASGLGWSILGSSASTTSGYITLRVGNMTGVNAMIPGQGFASSTFYRIISH